MSQTKIPNIQLVIGEVISSYDKTYDGNTNNRYRILVRTYEGTNSQKIYARPLDINIKKIPLVGELVTLLKGISEESTPKITKYAWYYSDILPVHSSLHHNALIGLSASNTDQPTNINQINELPEETENIGFEFTELDNVPGIQPYEGDLLFEGRFGNSIRIGSSSQTSSLYSSESNWGGTKSDPIIILSNRKPNNNKSFVSENLNSDYSGLWLTSTQNTKTLKLSKQLTKSNSKGGSQFIGSADKLILQAKKQSLVLDSVRRVSILTPELLIGSESASSPLVKGDILIQALRLILSGIRSGTIGTGGIYSTPDPGETSFASAEALLSQLNSNKFYFDGV